MPLRRHLTLLTLLALAACAENPERAAARRRAESDEAKTAIEAQLARFTRYAAAGQADSLAMLYLPDATVMPPNMPAVHGTDSLRAFFASAGPFDIRFQVGWVAADADMAIEGGTFTVSMTPPGAAATSSTGKYMARWHFKDGEWRMLADIWNEDAPMAPPAPAPAARRQ